ncbi:MAG: ATP-binding cassette domain-containing protein [Gammaproteobacteria bacterium]
MLHTNIITSMNEITALPLQIKNLKITKKGNSLLSDITLSIGSNEVTVILGPNGAGKSLLLRAAHGLEMPSQGSLLWNTHIPSPQHSWRTYIFQKPVLLRRSVRANLEYVLSLHNINKAEYARLIDTALELTGLSQLAHRQARVLSGGEQQRLNIARAWVLNPKVILLDEPTAELDPNGTAAIERLIKTIAQRGTKIIMSTHDLGQAHRLAGDIVFLHQGRLVEYTPATSFFNQPHTKIAQDFIAGKLLNGQ